MVRCPRGRCCPPAGVLWRQRRRCGSPAAGTAPRGLSPEKPLRKCWRFQRPPSRKAGLTLSPKPASCAGQEWLPAERSPVAPRLGDTGCLAAPLGALQPLRAKTGFFGKVGVSWEEVAEDPSCAWLNHSVFPGLPHQPPLPLLQGNHQRTRSIPGARHCASARIQPGHPLQGG